MPSPHHSWKISKRNLNSNKWIFCYSKALRWELITSCVRRFVFKPKYWAIWLIHLLLHRFGLRISLPFHIFVLESLFCAQGWWILNLVSADTWLWGSWFSKRFKSCLFLWKILSLLREKFMVCCQQWSIHCKPQPVKFNRFPFALGTKLLNALEMSTQIYSYTTILNRNMGCDQYTVPDDFSCWTYFCCFPLALVHICTWTLLPFFQISLRTVDSKPPTVPFGIVACTFYDIFLEMAAYYGKPES